ncbi:MAG: hypothetical protein AAGD28_06785 [Bacteroidota bacterium]
MLYKFSNSLRSFIIISILGLNGTTMLHGHTTELKADLAEEVESLESEEQSEVQERNELDKDYVEMLMAVALSPFQEYYRNSRNLLLYARELISIDPPPERI